MFSVRKSFGIFYDSRDEFGIRKPLSVFKMRGRSMAYRVVAQATERC